MDFYSLWTFSTITLEQQLRFQQNLDSSPVINLSWMSLNIKVIYQGQTQKYIFCHNFGTATPISTKFGQQLCDKHILDEFKYQGHRLNVKVIFQGQSQKYLEKPTLLALFGPQYLCFSREYIGLRSRSHAKVKVHAQGQRYRSLAKGQQ